MPTPHGAKGDDFAAWKKSVEQRLRTALARTATRPKLNVSNGGFDVTGGGAVRIFGAGGLELITEAGVPIFSARSWGPPYSEPDGDPQPMVQLKRSDGATVFLLGDPLPLVDDYQQFFAWYDRAGNIIFGDDTTTGTGLARPYTSYSITGPQDIVTLTSTAAFAEAHSIAGYVQSPRLAVPASFIAPAGGPAEAQIVHAGTGTVVAGPTAVPAGTNVAPFYVFNVPDTVDMFSHQYFSVQTRRVSGTGNVVSRVFSAHGIQS
jgi:hypothetical protein